MGIESANPVPRPWWHKSFQLDWVLALALFLSGCAVEKWAPVTQRLSPLSSPSSGTNASFAISKPFADPESVSTAVLCVIAFVVPVAFYLAFGIYRRTTDGYEKMHAATLALCAALSLTTLVVAALKVTGGRLRPDFLDRVRLDKADPGHDREHLGRLSWPSGHAALAATGMACLSLQAAGLLRTFAAGGNLTALVVVLIPQILGLYVAVSRTLDYRHNFDDILAGYVIGCTSACLVFLVYFHPLSGPRCGTPRSRVGEDEAATRTPEPSAA